MTTTHRDYRGAIVEGVFLDQTRTPVAVLTWPTRTREVVVEERLPLRQIMTDAQHYMKTAQQKVAERKAVAKEGETNGRFTSLAREAEKAEELFQAVWQILRQLDHSERYVRV